MPSHSIPTRPLGRTGEQVSCIGLGGWHLSLQKVSADLAHRLVRHAVDQGITFMDNSWDYNDGESERRMGKALGDGYRDRVFLMTKIDGRDRKTATRQLEECLRRLRTDRIDLVQHHEIIRYEDPHRIFDPDGANAALLDAREAGKLRYIGFTGHKDPRIHLHMLHVAQEQGFRFDTVQMPLNVMDAHYRSFEREVLPELVRDEIGVLGMKPMANGIILKSGRVTAVECLRYALHLPASVVITGCDSMEVLDQAIRTAREVQGLSREEADELRQRARPDAMRGQYEPFKTSSIFDGTASNPEWLGDEPDEVQALMQD